MTRRLLATLTMLVCFFLSSLTHAQVLKGSISGTVTDPQGAVVAGAQVTATNAATGAVFATTSDSSGSFRLNLIPVAQYDLKIAAQGYKTGESHDVMVVAGADRGLGSIRMAVGEAATTVEVTTAAPLVETSQSQVTATFSGRTLQTFAGIQENEGLDNLALFVPGVANSRGDNFSDINGAPFSVNGLRSRNNDQQIDGQNNNDNSVGGPYLTLKDSEFVQQYVLVTNQFGPEYGRNSGSVVNVITKSGTNHWHGSIFGNENNSVLNALNTTQKVFQKLDEPPRSNNEFSGFTIGGPMVKNKAFLFAGFDNQVSTQTGIFTTTSRTPTPAGLAQLAGCFPASSNLQVLDHFGPYGISDGNPTPLPNPTTGVFDTVNVGACLGVPVGGVQRILPQATRIFDATVKADLQLGSDTVTARYLFNRSESENNSDNGPAGYFQDTTFLSQAILATWTHNLSSHMVNEARVSFGRFNIDFGGNGNGFSAPSKSRIDEAVTNVSISGFLGFGPAVNLPQGRLVNTWQAQDNWNYVLGKHNFKAGVNWTHQSSPNIFLPDINGQYTFSNLLNFVNNTPSRVIIADGNTNFEFSEHDVALYFGDDWKVRPNLTINLGLTWSYFGQANNVFHDTTTERESNAATALWNPALPLSVRTVPAVDSHKSNFGPGIGFAYSPQWGGFLTGHGKTVVRGGFRMLYDPPFYNIYLNNDSSAPNVLLQIFTTTTVPAAGTLPLPAVPTGPNVRASLAPFIPVGVLDPRTQPQTRLSPDFGPDKVYSWSFGFERELTRNSAFEARYVGNRATDLFQSINGNPYILGLQTDFPSFVPAGLTPCPATQQVGPGAGTDVGRVHCGDGVLRIRSNTGDSSYHGLQLEFRANNLFKQLTMRSGYTWSKTTDNTSEIFSTSNAGNTNAFSQIPTDFTSAEHALSGLDFPHVWTTEFTEELPFLREQRGVTGHLLGGWGVAANYILASGQPFTPAQGGSAFETALGDYYDRGFVSAFSGEIAHPFLGGPNAPFDTVGVFAGDACVLFTATACGEPPTELLSMNAIGASCRSNFAVPCTIVPVTADAVHFIINARTAQAVFGTPFGNAGRNIGRDAKTNIVNLSVFKNTKIGERASFEFHATLLNAFNHSNFANVDAFVEDAGLTISGAGFADPRKNAASGRTVFVGGTFRF